MEEKLNRLREMVANNDPQAMSYLAKISAETTALADRRLLDGFAEELMSSVSKTLDTLENSVNEYTVKEEMGELAEALNFAYIARRYFGKSKSWLYHRMKGNIVNGKPAEFTAGERQMFNDALADIQRKISSFTHGVQGA